MCGNCSDPAGFRLHFTKTTYYTIGQVFYKHEISLDLNFQYCIDRNDTTIIHARMGTPNHERVFDG
jgi:hypothetical protein